MLGHKLVQILRDRCEVFAAFRHFTTPLRATGLFDEKRVVDSVDAWDIAAVRRGLEQVRPAWVVNCIGIIKQLEESHDAKTSIYVNALFPHVLSEVCGDMSARVIHVSTDCVFSGKRGDYTEDDPSDADDLYGRTKYLGEVQYEHALTLRTSVIGRDLFKNVSLIDWFLSQSGGRVKGHTNAIYNGLSTEVLSREVLRVVTEHPRLQGLYHVSSEKISKYDLLRLVNRVLQARVTIEPSDEVRCDRSLRSERYRQVTGFCPPTWEEMVAAMARDRTPYDAFRRTVV
jgi:dTDP-4-dehydrorhamnose reductase